MVVTPNVLKNISPKWLLATNKAAVLNRVKVGKEPKLELPELHPVNGVSHFILPLQRILFTYCSHNGDSRTTREWITKNLCDFARKNPSVEVVVQAIFDRAPMVYASYLDGHMYPHTLMNLPTHEITKVVNKVRNQSGQKHKPFHQGVTSTTPAIRPIWSPFTHSKPPLSGQKEAETPLVTQTE